MGTPTGGNGAGAAAPPARVRGGDGKFIRTIEAAGRDAEAARLRSRGMPFRKIAAELGYASGGKAHEAVARALAERVAEPVTEARENMLEQLDYLTEIALEVLESRHIVVQHGKVVYLGTEPLTDHGPVLDAIAMLLKIQERRAKILPGLEAPKRVEVFNHDDVDAAIRALEQQLAANDPPADPRRDAAGEAVPPAGSATAG